jgi:stage II sporulation protein D
MSQFGAYGFALHLKDYRFILGHYYTGTALAQLSANPEVRVLLQDGHTSVKVSGALSAGGQALDPTKVYTVRRGGDGLVVRDGDHDVLTGAGPIRLDPPVGQPLVLQGLSMPGVRDGRYRGGLIISASGAANVRAVNAVALEDYVRGVVSGESPSGWPAAALQAQAVAARTYAVTTGGGPNFDQFADVRSQVYRGVAAEAPATDAAVTSTAGQVVTFDGQPAVTYFFSTSGGETEDVPNSFLGSAPKPWLKAVQDPFDDLSPKHRWGPLRFTERQARSRLKGLVRGKFKRIKVLQRGVSPRVMRAQVVGTRGVVNITGPQLRARFGLFDTWAYFTSVSTAVKKGKQPANKVPAATPPTLAPPAPGDPSGGLAAAARVAVARPTVLTGTIAPAAPGARATLQRRVGTRWVAAGSTRLGAGGRYAVAVRAPGVYRVAYRAAVGPDVRVG